AVCSATQAEEPELMGPTSLSVPVPVEINGTAATIESLQRPGGGWSQYRDRSHTALQTHWHELHGGKNSPAHIDSPTDAAKDPDRRFRHLLRRRLCPCSTLDRSSILRSRRSTLPA